MTQENSTTSINVPKWFADVINTDLVNFVAAAYQMPGTIREGAIMRYDDLDTRNTVLFILIYANFLVAYKGLPVSLMEDPAQVTPYIDKHFQEFLAMSVVLTFRKD